MPELVVLPRRISEASGVWPDPPHQADDVVAVRSDLLHAAAPNRSGHLRHVAAFRLRLSPVVR